MGMCSNGGETEKFQTRQTYFPRIDKTLGRWPPDDAGLAAHHGSQHNPNPDFEPLMLDKKDEIWCYVLIKLFTGILEDPEEAQRLLKPTKSAFDIDLQPAVQQLKAAIQKKKSETSQVFTSLKNASSVVTSSSKVGQPVAKSKKSYDEGDSSRSSSSISSSSSDDSSDDDETIAPQTASHSIWTQRSVGDSSFRRSTSSAARNVNSKVRMEDVFNFLSSYAGKS